MLVSVNAAILVIQTWIFNHFYTSVFFEGSLEAKLPTIWTDEKHSQEVAEPGRNSDVEKVRREKMRDGENQQGEDAGAPKGRKVAKHCVFPMFCGSRGSNSRLVKAWRGAKSPDER